MLFDPTTRILIVDDMMTMRKIVLKCLFDMEFTDVQEAADGNLAWDVMKTSIPPIQFIVSDWNMPNCTGLEFLKKVRAEPAYAKIPFLMLTAEAEKQQVLDAIKAGVTNYCIKPFTPGVFKQKVEETFKKHKGIK